MSYKKTAYQLYMECAKEIYLSLEPKEKTEISYSVFLRKVAQKYSGIEDESVDISSGYRYFKRYFDEHPKRKNDQRAKKKGESVTYSDICPLLNYDTRKERLLEALGDQYHYSWFLKSAFTTENDKTKRMVLMIESDNEAIKKAYDILVELYADMFKSAYCGFGGMVLIFSKQTSFENFLEYIKKEN